MDMIQVVSRFSCCNKLCSVCKASRKVEEEVSC